MRARLSNHTQAPRKTRLVTDLVKGKGVLEALTLLKFESRRAATPIAKLIASAAANAEKAGELIADLYVKSITVDQGLVTTRYRARAFGRAAPLNRRRSHVTVILEKRSKKTPL